ncbi:MAG: hypothetical protein XD36_2434 [Halomonas sp. 54_146]|nr:MULTISPECIES: hypothetical protein [unclassified Halomonas]KUJ87150.1 MAG: hypothetical protein XD36_2434 [Halomonas sp. 54_146]
MSNPSQTTPMLLNGIPFEPGMDDLEVFKEALKMLPKWESMQDIFTEVLELAEWARDELDAWEVPPLPYFTELRPLIWQDGSINQHRSRAEINGLKDPLLHGIHQVLDRWDCPILKTLSPQALKAAYALAVSARSLKELTEWNPHPLDEGAQFDDLAARQHTARQALGLEPIYQTAIQFYRQGLNEETLNQLHNAQKQNKASEAKKWNNRRKYGRPGEVRKIHAWAHEFIIRNLDQLAYDQNGKRRTIHALSIELHERALHQEWRRLHPLSQYAPETVLPKVRTLRESKLWLKSMGLENLPEYQL